MGRLSHLCQQLPPHIHNRIIKKVRGPRGGSVVEGACQTEFNPKDHLGGGESWLLQVEELYLHTHAITHNYTHAPTYTHIESINVIKMFFLIRND